MDEIRFRTKSLGVDLYNVQDKYTWGRLSLGSGLIRGCMFFTLIVLWYT